MQQAELRNDPAGSMNIFQSWSWLMELNFIPVGRGSLGQGLACYIWSPSCQLSVVFESFSVDSFFPGKFIFSPEECPAETSFHMCPKWWIVVLQKPHVLAEPIKSTRSCKSAGASSRWECKSLGCGCLILWLLDCWKMSWCWWI